ncbi:hypothetical protein [Corynebacterium resistens]|uniref:hypothetical protein n=1 Tax=Corynebacterium resistens TaxID=258224 RepID=UPI0011D1A3CE|nr:hypothetical protein [Corynebacterium resistens]
MTRFKQEWRERLDSWKEQGQGGIEKKYAQSFWAELCAAFGATRKLTTERQRQELLFARYTELTS